MPMNRQILLILAIASVVFPGCGGGDALPQTWTKDIPGLYQAGNQGFTETIQFRSDGSYEHTFGERDKPVGRELGKWSPVPGKYRILLMPDGDYSEFYDIETKTLRSVPRKFRAYDFWPLGDGKSFSEITPVPDDSYRFKRVISQASVTK
jgi:hypothetical protein